MDCWEEQDDVVAVVSAVFVVDFGVVAVAVSLCWVVAAVKHAVW